MTKNADPDKLEYSGYGIRFDACGTFSLFVGSAFGKNVIKFGADMSSSVHIGNKKNDTVTFGKGLTDGFDDNTLTIEKNIL